MNKTLYAELPLVFGGNFISLAEHTTPLYQVFAMDFSTEELFSFLVVVITIVFVLMFALSDDEDSDNEETRSATAWEELKMAAHCRWASCDRVYKQYTQNIYLQTVHTNFTIYLCINCTCI